MILVELIGIELEPLSRREQSKAEWEPAGEFLTRSGRT